MANDRVLEMFLVARDKASAIFSKVESRAKKLGAAVKAAFKPIAIAVGIATTALTAGALIMGKAAAAAEKQRLAVKGLELALRNIGEKFVPEVSQEMQKFASSLQQVTIVGDEMILSGMAQIAMLGKLSGEGLKKATVAALDMSAAMGIDFQTASMLLARAAAGNISMLTRYGLTLETTGDKQKDFDNLLKLISDRMGGSASIATDSFTGKMTQLKNTLGDAFEQLGKGVNESDKLQKKIQELTQWIADNQERIEAWGEAIAEFAEKAIDFAIEKMLNFRKVLGQILLSFSEALDKIASMIETSARMQALLGVTGDVVRKLSAGLSQTSIELFKMQHATDEAREAADKHSKAVREERDEILELAGFVDATGDSMSELAVKTEEAVEETATVLDEFVPEIGQTGQMLGTELGGKFVDAYSQELPALVVSTEAALSEVSQSFAKFGSELKETKIEVPTKQLNAAIAALTGGVFAGGGVLTPQGISASIEAQFGALRGFQRGGIATKPTAGVFGEAGPEALIPLDRMGGMGKIITNNIVFNNAVMLGNDNDARQFAERIVDFINEENARR